MSEDEIFKHVLDRCERLLRSARNFHQDGYKISAFSELLKVVDTLMEEIPDELKDPHERKEKP